MENDSAACFSFWNIINDSAVISALNDKHFLLFILVNSISYNVLVLELHNHVLKKRLKFDLSPTEAVGSAIKPFPILLLCTNFFWTKHLI